MKGWKDEKLITLHEASKRQNPCNKFYGDNCSCQKGCSSRRCGCVIKGKPCTSHCHGGRPCKNEAQHITPGSSTSYSINGEGKDEAEHITPGSSPSNSTNGEGKDEAEHITPGSSPSNSTNGKGKDEAEHITPGSSPSNSTNGDGKDEAELITSGGSPSYSTNREYCSCKKGCSSRHCGCVMKGKKCSSLCHGGKPCKNEAECITPIWVSELSLNLDDKNAILLGDWLTDKHMSAANQLLKGDFCSVRIRQSNFGENFSFPILRGEGVQILHVDETHWICVSTIGCTFGELNVYDSRLTTFFPATLKVICSLLRCSKTEVTVKYHAIASNGSDCGVYAIACAASLSNGDEPSDQCWDEKKLCLHLLQCFESTSMSVFSTSAAAEMKAMHAQCTTFRDKILNTLKVQLYCICRLPWHKEDMIQCGTCMEWYHPSCLSLPYHIFKSSEPWRCSLCSVSRI